jgi:mevalonate kinase
MTTIRCSAPGKLILFGEHSVVYGTTAIAASLSSLRIQVKIQSVSLPSSKPIITIHLQEFSFTCAFHVEELRPAITASISSQSTSKEINTDVISLLQPLLMALTKRCQPHVFKSLQALLYLFVLIICDEDTSTNNSMNLIESRGTIITVESLGLPVGAGLGSSAAFSVSAAGAFLEFSMGPSSDDTCQVDSSVVNGGTVRRPSEERLLLINDWSFLSEKMLHGNPSGLDNTTSTFGGAISYVREPKSITRLDTFPQLHLMLVNTNVPRETSKLVANVGQLRSQHPNVINSIFTVIQNVVDDFQKEIEIWLEETKNNNDADDDADDEALHEKILCSKMSSLIQINQGLLSSISVSHPALDTICNISMKHGCASKLTGAGGGGCAFSLLGVGTHSVISSGDQLNKMIMELKEQQFNVDVGVAGGIGVAIHVEK